MSIGKIRREEFLPIALNFQPKSTVVFYSFGKLSVFFVNDFGFPHRLSHTILFGIIWCERRAGGTGSARLPFSSRPGSS